MLLGQVRSQKRSLLCVCQVCESCHNHDRDDHCAAKEGDIRRSVHLMILCELILADKLYKPLPMS